MKRIMILCVVALAATLWTSCDSVRETTSNSGPDKTSLPNTNGPGNLHMGNSNANSASMNANSNSSAAGNFWNEAAAGGMAEVELSRLASTKAQNADVKRFAQMMIADHTKTNDELKSLATRKSVVLPTGLDPAHQSVMSKLEGMSGAEFDRGYVDAMVQDHEASVQLFERQAESGTDPEAKAFASKTLPALQKHLGMIKDIQAKLK